MQEPSLELTDTPSLEVLVFRVIERTAETLPADEQSAPGESQRLLANLVRLVLATFKVCVELLWHLVEALPLPDDAEVGKMEQGLEQCSLAVVRAASLLEAVFHLEDAEDTLRDAFEATAEEVTGILAHGVRSRDQILAAVRTAKLRLAERKAAG
jgi:hypothetical protein